MRRRDLVRRFLAHEPIDEVGVGSPVVLRKGGEVVGDEPAGETLEIGVGKRADPTFAIRLAHFPGSGKEVRNPAPPQAALAEFAVRQGGRDFPLFQSPANEQHARDTEQEAGEKGKRFQSGLGFLQSWTNRSAMESRDLTGRRGTTRQEEDRESLKAFG
jgi:hypothetical protein